MKVKVGEKGRHLEIPEKWYRLEDNELVKEGDNVANIREVHWMAIDEDDIGLPANVVGDVVIRKQRDK